MTTLRAFPGLLSRATLVLALVCVGVAFAATSLSLQVPAGSTTVELAADAIRIDASDPVIVHLVSAEGTISGEVELLPGCRSADVTVTILGSPDVVIFDGPVTGPSKFEHFFVVHETGRGEN